MTTARKIVASGGLLGGIALVVYAVFRDQTTDSDKTGTDVHDVVVATGARTLGARAVEVLSRLLGAHGNGPKGSDSYHHSDVIDMINIGVYGDGKSLSGKPWCARAVRYAYEKAAQELGMPPPFRNVKGTLASVSSWKEKPFRDFIITAPKVGAALLLGDKHATLIAKVIDGSTVTTCEGNHGDAVANVKRTIKPGDTIVDVESFAAAHPAAALVAGLEGLAFLGAA